MKDKKTILIVVLVAVIVVLAGSMAWQSFAAGIATAREQVYALGTQDGRLVEQRDIITSILQTGYYIIPVVDENNESQQIVLGILQPDNPI